MSHINNFTAIKVLGLLARPRAPFGMELVCARSGCDSYGRWCRNTAAVPREHIWVPKRPKPEGPSQGGDSK